MNAAEILIAARERIAVPERWTQGANARTKTGTAVSAYSSEAFCWCSYRALLMAPGDEREAVRMFERANSITSVVDFNDAPNRIHPEVLAAFDRAIELAKAEAGQ